MTLDVPPFEVDVELRIDDIAHAGTTEIWELSVAAPATCFVGGILALTY